MRYDDLVTYLSDLFIQQSTFGWEEYPISHVKGVNLTTSNNQCVMDFATGISGVCLGHNHPFVLNAVIKQIETYARSGGRCLFLELSSSLLETLKKISPTGLDIALFGNNDYQTKKSAFQFAKEITHRNRIISITESENESSRDWVSTFEFPVEILSSEKTFTGSDQFVGFPHWEDERGLFKFHLSHFGNIHKLSSMSYPYSQIAAIYVNPMDGSSHQSLNDRLSDLRFFCDLHGILLILDERLTAPGRTGEMFAAQTFKIKPDILVINNSLANGFSLNVLMTSSNVMDRLLPGAVGSQFEANPISCAAALATLDVIRKDNLLENCHQMGERLRGGIEQLQRNHPLVHACWGKGLINYLELTPPKRFLESGISIGDKFLNACFKNGLLAFSNRNRNQKICFMPPLNVTKVEVDRALSIMDDSLKSIH